MKKKPADIEDISAAFDAAFAGDSWEQRGAKEKRLALKHDDGRRKRATGRTAQFNIKVKPELRQRVVQTAAALDKAIAVLVEEALTEWLAKHEKRGRT